MKRRVVVTGMGLVSPLGNSVDASFDAMINGENGVDFITLFDTTDWKVKIAGEVKNLDLEKYMDKKEIRRSDRVTQLALVAADEAYHQSGLANYKVDPYRFATYIGSGIGGLTTIYKEAKTSVERGQSRISPFFIPSSIINMVGAQVGIKYQAKGGNLPSVTACSAATNAIGEAFRAIRDGYIDIAITGGAEAPINDLGLGGFSSLKALDFSNDPSNASRPFDKTRSGFVIAEGAGILILESLEHAKARGAQILAEVVGYGTTSDAYHMTAPDEEAMGVTRAILNALDDGGLKREDIGYINAHGTSTYLNDKLETLGFKKAFKDHAKDLLVSSTKSMTGHALGAAGAIESIAVIKALETSKIPPTIHLNTPDEECDLDYVANTFKTKDMTYAMNVNIGFGGQNACVIFKKGSDL